MPPEQTGLLIGAIVTFFIAVFIAAGRLINWLPKYLDRLTEQKIKEREQKLVIQRLESDTNLETLRVEKEIELREALAQSEALQGLMTTFSQVLERHNKVDERNAANAEKQLDNDVRQIESQNKLANAIEAQTRAATTSQLWHENRANDVIDTVNVINEKLGTIERAGKSAIEALDRAELGINEVKHRLATILEFRPSVAQESTLLAIQTQLTSLALMIESLNPKTPVEVVKEPSLDDTIPLDPQDMLEVTRIFPNESEAPDKNPPNENLPKASGL